MSGKKIALEVRKKWKPRFKNSHKGHFGKIFILAGSEGFTGAAHLAAAGALKAGAGLITLGVPRKIYTVLARRQTEVMVRPFPDTSAGSFSLKSMKPVLNFLRSQEILALGPGISQNPETQKLVKLILKKNVLPLVLDADGLNALKNNPEFLKKLKTQVIITPHPGEFYHLFGKKVSDQGNDRKVKASWASKTSGVYVILKGSRTVVAAPDGKIYINMTGNPGMAKGGSGDVLTGIIAALLGQKFSPWDACRFGVYLHGLSGDLAASKIGEASMTASDLIDRLPDAIRKVRGI